MELWNYVSMGEGRGERREEREDLDNGRFKSGVWGIRSLGD